MIENNCETCNHKNYPDGGWCYMFREEPITRCYKHTAIPSDEKRALVDAVYFVADVGTNVVDFTPTPTKAPDVFESGGGGDFGGAGASGSWDFTDTLSDAASAVADVAGSTAEVAGDVLGGIASAAGDVVSGLLD